MGTRSLLLSCCGDRVASDFGGVSGDAGRCSTVEGGSSGNNLVKSKPSNWEAISFFNVARRCCAEIFSRAKRSISCSNSRSRL